MNRYPLWKYALIFGAFLICLIYALPNLYPSDPSLQISPLHEQPLEQSVIDKLSQDLTAQKLIPKTTEFNTKQTLIRFNDTETQLRAAETAKKSLGRDYIVAMNLAPSTPKWLSFFGAKPMFLGLDLRGGVHFLLEVDMPAARQKALARYEEEFRNGLREAKLTYLAVSTENDLVNVKFKTPEERAAALALLQKTYQTDLTWQETNAGDAVGLAASLSPTNLANIEKFALQQNITTLRKRVNELGVSEPIIQQQGASRIVVQLPGVQDSAQAKNILGATATLEFRLVDDTGASAEEALATKRIPMGMQLYKERNGRPILLKRQVMLTGDSITDANAGFDHNNRPSVNVVLDAKGATRFSKVTGENVQKPMAVVFIENKIEEVQVDGQTVRKPVKTEEVINVATIQEQLHKNFQITGLDSPGEANNLALLLRAGALAAPLYIVEERTVGPNLGQENIDKGFMSGLIGCGLVMLFMAVAYRSFGMIANAAVIMNVIMLIAAMSMIQATLTVPGIAGIVLTLGMAVDANVLINERIKEELANKVPVQTAIDRGYSQAFDTIFDANLTTLISAIALFIFGTGPIKGFAVTLAIGIFTTMFTAVLGSRAIVNLIYGGRRLEKLSI